MEVRGHGEDAKIGIMVINLLAVATALWAAKDVAVIPDQRRSTQQPFTVEGKTQMFVVHL